MRSTLILSLLSFTSTLARPNLIVRDTITAAAPSSTSIPSSGGNSSSVEANLLNIVSIITIGCSTACNFFINDLATCAKGTTQATIAACACSSTVLGDIRACAACISADATTTPSNSTTVVADYNAFVGLCAKDGLASVLGTVQVGESTTSVDHATATVSINMGGPTAIANIVSNSTSSSMAVSATATGAKSSCGKLVVGLGSAVGVLGAVVALL